MNCQISIPFPNSTKGTEINTGISDEKSENIIVNFSKFKINAVCLQNRFNNHFKDQEHLNTVFSSFLGTVLPKITSHKYSQICQGSVEGQTLHFHTIDEEHRSILRDILVEYGYPTRKIDQMFEGNNLFEFSATLGHVTPARAVVHKVDNIFYLLFFDTNHHIYINEKYVGESLFYEECPKYLNGSCNYMPNDCFAFGYLDENKIAESFGYSYGP